MGLTDPMMEKGISLNTAVTSSVFYMGFNMLDPVVGGDSESARLLRLAISIAMDYEEYISIFNNGRGVAAQGPIPPGIFGNRSGADGLNRYVYELQEDKIRRKGIEQARDLMKQAGYPEGRDLKTGKSLILYYDTTSSGPDGKARLNWMRKQFAKLGVQLVIRASDYNRFQEKMRKGTGQIFMWGWNADYPDPENFLFLLYGPNGKVEHGGENAANYSNPEFDKLFVQMKNMENSPQRQLIIDQMVEIAAPRGTLGLGLLSESILSVPRLVRQRKTESDGEQYTQIQIDRSRIERASAGAVESTHRMAVDTACGGADTIRGSGCQALPAP